MKRMFSFYRLQLLSMLVFMLLGCSHQEIEPMSVEQEAPVEKETPMLLEQEEAKEGVSINTLLPESSKENPQEPKQEQQEVDSRNNTDPETISEEQTQVDLSTREVSPPNSQQSIQEEQTPVPRNSSDAELVPKDNASEALSDASLDKEQFSIETPEECHSLGGGSDESSMKQMLETESQQKSNQLDSVSEDVDSSPSNSSESESHRSVGESSERSTQDKGDAAQKQLTNKGTAKSENSSTQQGGSEANEKRQQEEHEEIGAGAEAQSDINSVGIMDKNAPQTVGERDDKKDDHKGESDSQGISTEKETTKEQSTKAYSIHGEKGSKHDDFEGSGIEGSSHQDGHNHEGEHHGSGHLHDENYIHDHAERLRPKKKKAQWNMQRQL